MADKVCPDCNCDIDVHDFQHFARYCYPAQIKKLKALLDEKEKEADEVVKNHTALLADYIAVTDKLKDLVERCGEVTGG